jgi:uncharacterized protein (TIGR02598 family)
MNCRTHCSRGFSLIEVTLALGVAAFCLLALLGLLPLGVQTNQSSISQTAAGALMASVVADLRATPKASPTSAQYAVTFGAAKVLYFDVEGRPVPPDNPNSNGRYRLTITFPPSPVGSVAPTFACLKVSWPASVDPATTMPLGLVETFAAFDRH